MRPSIVLFLLSRHKTQDELKKEISSEIPTDENIQGAGVKISPKMEAHLTGEAFNIVAVAPEIQVLDARENEWKWDIRPKREGLHPLHIALSIMVDGTPHFEHSFDRVIGTRDCSAARRQLFVPPLGMARGICAYSRRHLDLEMAKEEKRSTERRGES